MLDYFANKKSLSFKESKGDYFKAEGSINNQNFLLVKPITYVNNSGFAAKQLFEKYNPSPEEFLVICDDTNLKTLDFRVRLSGSDGGHNGLSSIIYHLIEEKFPRIRIGIGHNPPDKILSDYVLSKFSETELKEYQDTFSKCSVLIEEFIIGGTKRMLETNSILIKNENQNNLNH